MKKLALLMVLVMSLCFLIGEVALAKKAGPPIGAGIPAPGQTPLVTPTGARILYLGTWMGEMDGFPERNLFVGVGMGNQYTCVKNRYGDFLCFRDILPECRKTTKMDSVEIAIVRTRMFPGRVEYWPPSWYWDKNSDEVLLLSK